MSNNFELNIRSHRALMANELAMRIADKIDAPYLQIFHIVSDFFESAANSPVDTTAIDHLFDKRMQEQI